MTIDIPGLQAQVQANCNISDARHAGVYSLCGLLLRLRDLYKWEQALLPWQEPAPDILLEWVEARESLWESIASNDFQALNLAGRKFDPFDVEAVNALLRPSRLLYGAGYATGMKPTFLLATLQDTRTLGDQTVDILDGELARDIFTTPAMRQGTQILARRSSMLFFLWDQIMEMRPSAKNALVFALSQYGLDAEALRRNPGSYAADLHTVANSELEVWIHHEIGEVRSNAFAGELWQEIVSSYPNTPVELFARVVKDLIADTHEEGLLHHIIQNRIKSSLGFYIAFMRPFARVLFPEARKAFQRFQENGDWSIPAEARKLALARALQYAHSLAGLHAEGRNRGTEYAGHRIVSELIEPLGVLAKKDRPAPDDEI